MSDVTWNIETADYGTLTATSVLSDTLPTFKVGGEVSLEFYFGPGITNHETYYQNSTEFVKYTSDSTIDAGTDIRGKPWYRETLHPNADFSTTLVKIVPSDNVTGVDSYWAVIIGGEDNTRYVGAGERVTLEMFILAEGSEYATREDVEDDLKAEL